MHLEWHYIMISFCDFSQEADVANSEMVCSVFSLISALCLQLLISQYISYLHSALCSSASIH